MLAKGGQFIASYKTPVMILIYIYLVQSDKSHVGDRGKNIIYVKRNIGYFVTFNQNRDEDRIISVAITST